MLPQNIAAPIVTLGSACIVICISIFHYFRERVDDHIQEEMTVIFTSKETTSFINGIKDGKVTPLMLRDFYNQIAKVWKTKSLLSHLWTCFPISGTLFIVAGLIGSLVNYENLLYDYVNYFLLTMAIALFILGIVQLLRLGKRLL